MNPIEFPECNSKLAKSQPQFKPLPIFIIPTEDKNVFQFTGKYELSDLEIEQIIKTRSFYFSQFGSCFHPICPQIENPFGYCLVHYKKIEENVYSFWIPMSDGRIEILNNITIGLAMTEIMCWANLNAEQIFFVEKPSLGVDVNGNIIGL